MQKYSGLAMDTAGNVLGGATVTVFTAGTALLAPIYSDNVFTPQANPFTAEADGTCFFYSHGRVDVVFDKDGYAFRDAQTADIFLYDPMSVLSFSASAQQNDYTPTNGLAVATWRLTATDPFTITGIAAGFAGQTLTLINISPTNVITLANDSVSSNASNRILTGGGDYALNANTTAILQYDGTTAKWRVVGVTAVSSTTIISGSGVGTPGAVGLVGNNNTTNPTTQYDVSATLITLRATATGALLSFPSYNAVVSTTVPGPAANGRDQSGSFSANIWLHLYAIGKADGTTAGTWSITPPPTGPNMPATYTHWAYLGAFRHDASSQLATTRLRGSRAFTTSFTFPALSTAAEVPHDVSTLVPPNATSYNIWFTQAAAGQLGKIRLTTGGATYFAAPTNLAAAFSWTVTVPNHLQTFYFKQETANIAILTFNGEYENAH